MGVGRQIKSILRTKKMTIKQLSQETGIPINTLYSITKRDSTRVDTVILEKIATALECNVRDLTPGARETTREHLVNLEIMMGQEEGYLEENAVQQMRRTREKQLLTAYGKLNDFGQAVALADVENLSTKAKYTDSLEPRTDEERLLADEGRLAELWEKRYSVSQETPAATSEGRDTAHTENAATGPQEGK